MTPMKFVGVIFYIIETILVCGHYSRFYISFEASRIPFYGKPIALS